MFRANGEIDKIRPKKSFASGNMAEKNRVGR